MTILVTGSTSAQANPKSHRNSANFMGMLVRAIAQEDINVNWRDPSMSWTTEHLVDDYEHVVVGLAPVTSLSANRVYGALSVIGHMLQNAPKQLTIVLDAPEPQRIGASFRSVIKEPSNLCKPFYSYRKEYEQAAKEHLRLIRIIHRLANDEWPRVVVPALPWHQGNHLSSQLPYPVKKLIYMNLDEALVTSYRSALGTPRRQDRWLSDEDTQRVLRHPVTTVHRRGADGWDRSVLHEMSSSLGLLVNRQRFGTWWSTRYAQAIATGTPICADWQETRAIGPSWSTMPSQVEDMTVEQRTALARAQATEYLTALEKFDIPHNQVYALLNRRVHAPRKKVA